MISGDASSHVRYHRNVNQSCPSLGLPVEVLCEIFRVAGRYGLDLRTNLNITTVCSLWREVAHADPWMWTCLEIKEPNCPPREVIESLVKRSRPCPLEIYCAVSLSTWLSDLVYANIDRLAVLDHLCISDKDLHSGPAAPRLKHLQLFVAHGQLILQNIPTISDARRLDKLSMLSCRFPWRSPLYGGLTDLGIATLERAGDPDDDILNLPHISPNLQHLHIRLFDLYNDMSPRVYHSTPAPLHMHALRTLKLLLPDELALRLLRGIILPEQIRVIQISVCCHSPETLDSLVKFRYLPTRLFADCHSLCLSSDCSRDFRANWTLNVLADGCTSQGVDYWLGLQIEYTSNASPRACNIHTLLPTHTKMPLLQQLMVSDFEPRSVVESADALATFLVSAPALDTLEFRNKGFLTQFEAFRRALLKVTDPPSHRALPRLKCIKIGEGHVEFDNARDGLKGFADAVPLIQLFEPHLREVRVELQESNCEGDDDLLVRIVEGLRRLSVSEIWWGTSFYRTGDGGQRTYARDFWPRGEPYTWRCTNEWRHGESTSLDLSSMCEYCGAPLRELVYAI